MSRKTNPFQQESEHLDPLIDPLLLSALDPQVQLHSDMLSVLEIPLDHDFIIGMPEQDFLVHCLLQKNQDILNLLRIRNEGLELLNHAKLLSKMSAFDMAIKRLPVRIYYSSYTCTFSSSCASCWFLHIFGSFAAKLI